MLSKLKNRRDNFVVRILIWWRYNKQHHRSQMFRCFLLSYETITKFSFACQVSGVNTHSIICRVINNTNSTVCQESSIYKCCWWEWYTLSGIYFSYRKKSKLNKRKTADTNSVDQKLKRKMVKSSSVKKDLFHRLKYGRPKESNTHNSGHVQPDACTPPLADVKGRLISLRIRTTLLTFWM